LVAFSLALHHFRYALVVLSDALHDRFGLRVLKALSDSERFLDAEVPVFRMSKPFSPCSRKIQDSVTSPSR
jgi:hypothetical protein